MMLELHLSNLQMKLFHGGKVLRKSELSSDVIEKLPPLEKVIRFHYVFVIHYLNLHFGTVRL